MGVPHGTIIHFERWDFPQPSSYWVPPFQETSKYPESRVISGLLTTAQLSLDHAPSIRETLLPLPGLSPRCFHVVRNHLIIML